MMKNFYRKLTDKPFAFRYSVELRRHVQQSHVEDWLIE